MAGEILVRSRPVQGVKLSSRIERKRYRTVLFSSKCYEKGGQNIIGGKLQGAFEYVTPVDRGVRENDCGSREQRKVKVTLQL